jgi:hypothetical protein
VAHPPQSPDIIARRIRTLLCAEGALFDNRALYKYQGEIVIPFEWPLGQGGLRGRVTLPAGGRLVVLTICYPAHVPASRRFCAAQFIQGANSDLWDTTLTLDPDSGETTLRASLDFAVAPLTAERFRLAFRRTLRLAVALFPGLTVVVFGASLAAR